MICYYNPLMLSSNYNTYATFIIHNKKKINYILSIIIVILIIIYKSIVIINLLGIHH